MSSSSSPSSSSSSSSSSSGLAPGVLPRAGEVPKRTPDEILADQLRKLSKQQLEKLKEAKQKPIQVKRKTLSDYLRRDATAMTLLRVANASYDRELNKYNVTFQPSSMA